MTTINKRPQGAPANIPAWLSDPEGVAPCFCGRPLQPGEPHIVATGENDLKRWFHAVCWGMMHGMDEDDLEDWFEDDDD